MSSGIEICKPVFRSREDVYDIRECLYRVELRRGIHLTDLSLYTEAVTGMVNICRNCDITCIWGIDKSFRPFYWMLDSIWNKLSPDFPMPEFFPIDVDYKDQWRYLSPKEINLIQSRYHVPETGNMLVVDEEARTGATLLWTLRLLQKAYPQRNILAHHAVRTSDVFWRRDIRNSKLLGLRRVIRENGVPDLITEELETPESKGLRRDIEIIAKSIYPFICMTGEDSCSTVLPSVEGSDKHITNELNRSNLETLKNIVG